MKRNNNKIHKHEAILILFFMVFGIAWLSLFIPYMQHSEFFENANPVVAYLFYNLGAIIIFTIFLGMPIAYFVYKKVDVFSTIRSGLATFIGFGFIPNLLTPSFSYNSAGQLIMTPTSENMLKVSADYVMGWVYTQFEITGVLLYYAIYYLTPLLAIITIALLLKPKQVLCIFNL